MAISCERGTPVSYAVETGNERDAEFVTEEGIFIEGMTSDRKLKASREGPK